MLSMNHTIILIKNLKIEKNVKIVNSNIKQNLCDSALHIVSKQQLRLTGETSYAYLIKVSFVFNVKE